MSISLKTRRRGRISDSDPIDFPVSVEVGGMSLEFSVVNSNHVRVKASGDYTIEMRGANAFADLCEQLISYLEFNHAFVTVDSGSVKDSVLIWPSNDEVAFEAMVSEMDIDVEEYSESGRTAWEVGGHDSDYWHLVFREDDRPQSKRCPWFYLYFAHKWLLYAIDEGSYIALEG